MRKGTQYKAKHKNNTRTQYNEKWLGLLQIGIQNTYITINTDPGAAVTFSHDDIESLSQINISEDFNDKVIVQLGSAQTESLP